MPNTRKPTNRKAYIITGPTSGIGRAAAFEVAKHGTAILVGRSPAKLSEVRKAIEQKGGQAVSVTCDLSDMESVRRAAAEIVTLDFPIGGLLNNAGISPMRPVKSAQGWDLDFRHELPRAIRVDRGLLREPPLVRSGSVDCGAASLRPKLQLLNTTTA